MAKKWKGDPLQRLMTTGKSAPPEQPAQVPRPAKLPPGPLAMVRHNHEVARESALAQQEPSSGTRRTR